MFNIGDRVEILGEDYSFTGYQGTIRQIVPSHDSYNAVVYFDEPQNDLSVAKLTGEPHMALGVAVPIEELKLVSMETPKEVVDVAEEE